MLSFKFLLAFVCAGIVGALVGCNRTKIADDRNEEVGPEEFKTYIVPALEKDHQIRVEVTADEEFYVTIGIAGPKVGDEQKMGEVLQKTEKVKSAKLEVKIPAGKEVLVEIRVEKKCMVKTSIHSS